MAKRVRSNEYTIRARARALARYYANRPAMLIQMRNRRTNNIESARVRERATQRINRAVNGPKLREDAFRRKYGITFAERDAKLTAQGGGCALCGTSEFGVRGPQMDHDHATDKNREVLCIGCNIGLGAFCDNPQTLRNAADYVERHRGIVPAEFVDEHW